MSQPTGKTTTGIPPNIAGSLSYLALWVSGIIFLIIEKENRFVRFHAVQSIIVFALFTILDIILFLFVPFVGVFLSWLLFVFALILWVILMYAAYLGKKPKLPIAGNIAEKLSGPVS